MISQDELAANLAALGKRHVGITIDNVAVNAMYNVRGSVVGDQGQYLIAGSVRVLYVAASEVAGIAGEERSRVVIPGDTVEYIVKTVDIDEVGLARITLRQADETDDAGGAGVSDELGWGM